MQIYVLYIEPKNRCEASETIVGVTSSDTVREWWCELDHPSNMFSYYEYTLNGGVSADDFPWTKGSKRRELADEMNELLGVARLFG